MLGLAKDNKAAEIRALCAECAPTLRLLLEYIGAVYSLSPALDHSPQGSTRRGGPTLHLLL